MTLDDETAANIAREVVGSGKAARVYPHPTDVALVRAGYAARDAEVEELRAARDSFERQAQTFAERGNHAEATLAKVASAARGFAANGDFAAQVILAILDESPTERETPVDEVTAPEVLKAVDDFRRIQDADFEHYDVALAGYLMAEFKITRRGGFR